MIFGTQSNNFENVNHHLWMRIVSGASCQSDKIEVSKVVSLEMCLCAAKNS